MVTIVQWSTQASKLRWARGRNSEQIHPAPRCHLLGAAVRQRSHGLPACIVSEWASAEDAGPIDTSASPTDTQVTSRGASSSLLGMHVPTVALLLPLWRGARPNREPDEATTRR